MGGKGESPKGKAGKAARGAAPRKRAPGAPPHSTERRKLEADQGLLQQALEEQNEAMGELRLGLEDKEEALRESQERYRLLAENVTDVIWTMDTDMRFTFISPSITRQRGFSVEEAMALKPEESLTPASLEAAMKAVGRAQALLSGEQRPLQAVSWSMELEVYRKDGSTIWTEVESSFVHDSDGRPAGVVGVTRNITERKLAEEALRESEARLREAQRVGNVGDWQFGVDTQQINWSEEVYRLFERDPAQGPPTYEENMAYYCPEDSQRLQEQVRRAIESGEESDSDYQLNLPSGRTVFQRGIIRVRKDGDGKVTKLFGTVQDITERKRAEEALRQSEEYHRTLLDNAMEAIAVVDSSGTVLYESPSYKHVLGRNAEDQVGVSSWDLIHPDDLPNVAKVFEEMLRNPGSTAQAEVRSLHDDGSYRTLEVTGRNLLDDPVVHGIVANFRDVTERKQTEEALRTSERRFRRLAEDMNDGYCVLLGARIVFANSRVAEMFGYTPDEVIGKAIHELLPPEVVAGLAEKSEKRRRGDASQQYEVTLVGKDGTTRPVEFGTSATEYDGEPAVSVLIRDITERKRAEALVLEAKERYERLTDNADEAIFRVDAEGGHVVYVNAAAERIFGYSQAEWLGDPTLGFRIIHPDSIEKQRQIIEEIGTSKRTMKNEVLTWIAKDGRQVVMEYAIIPVIDEHGEVACFESIGRDVTERRQAEEAVRHAHAELDQVFNTAASALRLVDKDFNMLRANESFHTLAGISADEAPGKKCYEVFPDAACHTDRCTLARIMRGEEHVEYDAEKQRSDGSKVQCLLVATPYTGPDGELIGMVQSFADITERKLAEEALRDSEQKYRGMFDNMLDGFGYHEVVLDRDGIPVDYVFLEVNDRFERYTGLKRDSIIGRRVTDVIPGIRNADPDLISIYGQVALTGDPAQFSIYFEPFDRHYYVSVYGPRKGFFVTLFQDITERKQAEEALSDSEQRYRLLAENATDVITSTDLNLNPTYMSPSITRLLGYTPEESMARTLDESLTPASREVAVKALARQLECEKGGTTPGPNLRGTEMEFYRKDGSTVWVEVRTAFLRDSNGQPAGLVNMLCDITERRRVEDERQRMEQKIQLTGRLAAVGELAAGVAHELNNPLAAVQGFAQLLAERNDLDESMRGDVETIHKEAKRASKITSNLLSFARKHEPEKRFISINDALAQSVDLHAYRMRVNNIEISSDPDPDLPATMADTHQLQQVFVNLITNAEQAMTEAHGKGTLSIKTEAVDEVIRITFSDDGPGIPEENLTNIFDPFFTTKAVGKGTGLGLSICFGIVQQHGGHLHAGNEPGKGATFVVEIPIVSEGQAVLDSSGLDQTGATRD